MYDHIKILQWSSRSYEIKYIFIIQILGILSILYTAEDNKKLIKKEFDKIDV